MDLQNFIKESLVQISKGIEDANEELIHSGASINPPIDIWLKKDYPIYATAAEEGDKGHKPGVHLISFDVALHAESGSQKGGGLKVAIASVGVGAEGKATKTNSSESRIQFEIPMVFPSGGFSERRPGNKNSSKDIYRR